MTPEIETHHEIHKTHHSRLDIAIALCAIVLSITSLAVAILHGRTMERMADANARLVAANSWPLLQRYNSNLASDGARVSSLNVVNSGVGPAKVETLELLWKGSSMRTAAELLEACCQLKDAASDAKQGRFDGLETSSLQGMVLRAGENRRLIELPHSKSNADAVAAFDRALTDVAMRVCYCSVFDECWQSDLRQLHPEGVKQCAVPKVMFVVN
jgi:hypothetical protein